MLSASDRAALEHLARTTRAEDDGNGVQLQFLLVPSLEGEPIEDFSIRVAEAWKLGTKGQDNGLLFVVSRDDHRMRIEVGGGLEGKLPDVLAGRIVDGTLRPAFREGRFGAGLLDGAAQALAAIGGRPGAIPTGPTLSARGFLEDNWPVVLFFLLFLLFPLLGSRRWGRGGWSGGWSGGVGGWSSGGGGGWSGGGGGFSGGGASGSW